MDNPITNWLLQEGWTYNNHEEFTAHLSDCLLRAGIKVDRIRLTIRLLHPQVLGFGYTWTFGQAQIDYFEAGYEMRESDMYLESPFAALFEDNMGAIRRRIHSDLCKMDYPILLDLKDEGFTDYVALPLDFSDGRRSAITLASKAENGFSTEELTMIYDCLPALARIIENNALKHTARVLLETYLGKETGRQVLSGMVKRGDGQRIRAIIWFSDLRQSTTLAETMDHEDFLKTLNRYFECTAGSVLENGGEVLRYIGDAVLAIFPLESDDLSEIPKYPATAAIEAAKMTFHKLQEMNDLQTEENLPIIRCGVGLHVGEVMYGNIGTKDRLEFSVIGSSANEASRIEEMTKKLGKPFLASDQFHDMYEGKWQTLGFHSLKDFEQDRELFTLPEINALGVQ